MQQILTMTTRNCYKNHSGLKRSVPLQTSKDQNRLQKTAKDYKFELQKTAYSE